ncbi:histidine kinase [Paenibacillus sp. Y412MC10]|uniref:histidine kinase n=1 Tax=Geobacillus sp. (strain Y412MC10) TaxID=481743 RepID=UPI0011A36B0F|nr:histidine kinase [Paenibacillus sp. Y412MC10]
MGDYRRKSPEEILEEIQRLRRGRLKIIIGAVTGSGKTYHMLREGQTLKSQGIDVVICAVSTLQRTETKKQLADLERVPSIHWNEGETEYKDLNLPGIVSRNPEVVLVDGLAHRNRKDAEHRTRLEDIQFLLNHGISVITTVNVYEIEGIHELARKWTGVEVKETVPLTTLGMADEVRLIDVSPETLISRLNEGHLRSIRDGASFTRKDLTLLRELALRLMADDVNQSLEKFREHEGISGPSGASERILVAAQYHWNGSIYVRRGQQIAKRLNGELLVVVFTRPKQSLSREQEAFKRSLHKMADKTDAKLEELPLSAPRRFAKSLIRYAFDKKVTRIVLGHSRKSPWQELWQGSVTNGILKHAHGIDVFWVADRTAQGEPRILPARRMQNKQGKGYHRLSREEMNEKVKRIERGRFKIYIGAAPGVGKTYTMLREGNDILAKGTGVVIGWLETHGRAETAAQVGSLPVIPPKEISYKGTTLYEMDTEALLARSPELVLVDELPHTNMPGSRFRKRYEDILLLLENGISVITTLNIQHLESLNDAVERIAGIRVSETVPDTLLSMADEVELIDVTPQSLQERMREGKIYAADKVDQALGSFFRTGNLIALRELALRELADDVDERLESWQRNMSLRGPWRKEEVIFVCILPGTSAERLIRRGFRIAYRLKAALHVTCVRMEGLDCDLGRWQGLTESLQGHFGILDTDGWKELPAKVLGQAEQIHATQMILGRSEEGIMTRYARRRMLKRLIHGASRIDVLLV